MVSGLRSRVVVVSMRPETTCLADECNIGIYSATLTRRIYDHAMLTTQTPAHIQLASLRHTIHLDLC